MNNSDSFAVGKALFAPRNTNQQEPAPYQSQPRHEQSAQEHPAYSQQREVTIPPPLLKGVEGANKLRYSIIKDDILPRSKLPTEAKQTLMDVLDFCEQEKYATASVSAILICIEMELYPTLSMLENTLAKRHIKNANAIFTTLIKEIAITMLVATQTLEPISPQNTAKGCDKNVNIPIKIPLAAASLLVSMLSPPSTANRLVENAKNGQIDWYDFAQETSSFVTAKLNERYLNPAAAPQPSTSSFHPPSTSSQI